MGKYTKQIIKMTAQEMLLSIIDLATPFFAASSIYRVSANNYIQQRSIEKSNFSERIKYLKKRGLIETFVEGKDKYIEITPKGIDRATKLHDLHPVIDRMGTWDKKWRIVIFDIPEKYRNARDSFRNKLIEMGFIQVQDSVYLHPFECSEIIRRQAEILLIEKYVLLSISEIIQGEEKIIEKFIEKKVLLESDLN